MTDNLFSQYIHYGTAAQRAAFTPDPPAGGYNPLYIWFETDTGDTYGYDGSWNQLNTGTGGGSIYDTLTPPSDASFAWTNQGGATSADTYSGIYLQVPAAAGANWRCKTKSIGANTRLEIAILPNFMSTTPQGGLLLRESGTGKIAMFTTSPGTPQFAIQHAAGPTSAATNDLVSVNWRTTGLMFFAIELSGANILYSVSGDGANWIQVFSIAKTTQFTTAPDEWGFTLLAGQASYDAGMTIASFIES